MIYTSYFAHVKNHPRIASGELRAMSIALSAPAGWPDDEWAPALRPWPFMEKQYKADELTAAGYELRYRECVLRNISAEFILDHYDNCILCCHESPDKWCHRRIVQKWIAEKTGIIVKELDSEINTISIKINVECTAENQTCAYGPWTGAIDSGWCNALNIRQKYPRKDGRYCSFYSVKSKEITASEPIQMSLF